MKMQYAIVRPGLYAEPGISVIAGIVISRDVLPDFAAHQIIIDPDDHEGCVRLVDLNMCLDSRLESGPAGAVSLQSSHFNEVLAKRLLNPPELPLPAGEVALVATDLPGTPEGQHAYAMFGLIRGTDKDLGSIAERIFEVSLDSEGASPANSAAAGTPIDTGQAAVHEMAHSNLLGILTQPIWGYANEKVGMSSLTTRGEYANMVKGREHMLAHGSNRPGVRAYHDPSTVDLLRGYDAHGARHPNHWTTSSQNAERTRIARKAWKAMTAPTNEPNP